MGTAKSRKNTIDALELLTQQHAALDALIERIENEALIERKQYLFDELADHLAAHATMEEKLFYPTVRAEQTQEILPAASEQHLAIKRALAELLATDVDDARFDAKLAVLEEELRQHAHEEEEEILFPKLRRLMTQEQLTLLGSEMLALFERLMAGKPRQLVTATATPGAARAGSRA